MGLAIQALVRASSLRFLPGAMVLLWTCILLARAGRRVHGGYSSLLGYLGTSLIILVLFWPEAVPFGTSGVVVDPEQVRSYAAVTDGGAVQSAADTRDVPSRLLSGAGIPPGFRLLLRAITETPLALARAISSTAHRPFSALLPMQYFLTMGLPADIAGGVGDWAQGCYGPALTTFKSSPGGATYQELLPWSPLMQIELGQRVVFPGAQTASQWLAGLFVPTQPVSCAAYLKTLETQVQKWLFTAKTERGTVLRDLFTQELGLPVEDQAQFLVYRESVRATGPDVPPPSLVGTYAGLRAGQIAGSAVGGLAGSGKAGGIAGAIAGAGNELHRAIDGASWMIGLAVWLTFWLPYVTGYVNLVMVGLFPFALLWALTPGQQGPPLMQYFAALLLTCSMPLWWALVDVASTLGMAPSGSEAGLVANVTHIMTGWYWSATATALGVVLVPIVVGILFFASFRGINSLWRGGI